MTMETKILKEIEADLSFNYYGDEDVLKSLLDDVINDALFMSNRKNKTDRDNQLEILKSNIKKAVKSIYLQRGTEDVSSGSSNGESNNYSNAMEIMEKDIIRQNKRLMI